MRLMINVLRLSLLRDSGRSLSEGLTLMISAEHRSHVELKNFIIVSVLLRSNFCWIIKSGPYLLVYGKLTV
jgi:hypothetical protein